MLLFSGNKLLKIWSTLSLMKAGLCNQHFQEEDFMDATKVRLRRNKNPIHWKNVQNVREAQPTTEQQKAEHETLQQQGTEQRRVEQQNSA